MEKGGKMEAKDTVMMPEQTRAKRKQLFPHGHKNCFECEQFAREAQAEITAPIFFKAGQEQGLVVANANQAENIKAMRRAGIREVVESELQALESLQANALCGRANATKYVDISYWNGVLSVVSGRKTYYQAKLKEWEDR